MKQAAISFSLQLYYTANVHPIMKLQFMDINSMRVRQLSEIPERTRLFRGNHITLGRVLVSSTPSQIREEQE